MSRQPTRAILGVVAVLWVAGCGPGTGAAGNCPQDTPASCPGPAPAYTSQVAPVMMRRCRPCHTAGGVEATAPFDTYDQVHARRAEILGRLKTCLMPPADQPQLTAEERAAVLGWLVCGAQND